MCRRRYRFEGAAGRVFEHVLGMFASQHSIRGQVVLRGMGIDRIPVTNVENACAGASTALHLACAGIRADMFDVALTVGSEKITHPNKAMSLGAYASCMDVENFERHIQMITDVGKTFKIDIPGESGAPGEGRSIFMDAYAMGARWHMDRFGSTQRQLAVICSKNHFHGSLNSLAQYQNAMTVEEVLADRAVAYPLTRAMCAPVGDGAAAAIVCSERYLKKLNGVRPVRILASVMGQGRRQGSTIPISAKGFRSRRIIQAGVSAVISAWRSCTTRRRGGDCTRRRRWDSALSARAGRMPNRVPLGLAERSRSTPAAASSAGGIPSAHRGWRRFMNWLPSFAGAPVRGRLRGLVLALRKTAAATSASRRRRCASTFWSGCNPPAGYTSRARQSARAHRQVTQ